MNVIKAILGEASDKETRTYAITARPDHLDKIEQLFSWMNMTRGGHSGEASIAVDGDGAARITVEREKGDLPKYRDIEKEQQGNAHGVEFHVGLE